MSMSRLRDYPVTIAVSVFALLAWLSPTLSLWWQLDFNAVGSGQLWRIWTGHVTHYDGNHLFWDLLMFAVLSGACEHRHALRIAPALAIMAAVISVTVAACCGEVTAYRGLSGIDTGLFVWFVADQCHDCWRRRDTTASAFWILLAVGLIGKLLYEVTTGAILFVDASGFTPLVESHLAGAASGLFCYRALRHTPDNRSQRSGQGTGPSTPLRIFNHRNHEQSAVLALATVLASANRTVANAKTANKTLTALTCPTTLQPVFSPNHGS